ncbi:hypothetical protein ACNQGB_08165 [Flavobacterium sp. XS1P32]|uniref:hypothetical protein n=1 Tax=Flavobacterium sp. XS1P32 TaxID=3401726 RepID=UPI003AAE801D
MQLSVPKNGKAAFVALFILMTMSHSNAQEKPAVEKSQFKINALLPGFVYEHGLSDKNTLYSELSLGLDIHRIVLEIPGPFILTLMSSSVIIII